MILKALADYYDRLLEMGKIAAPGWDTSGITYELYIDASGSVKQIVDVRREVAGPQNKTKQIPKDVICPVAAHRSSGIASSFMVDNAKYMLGLDYVDEDKDESKIVKKELRAKECFNAARELHRKILKDVHTTCAESIKAFFEKWNPDEFSIDNYSDIDKKLLLTKANISFHCSDGYPLEDPEIIDAWNNYYAGDQTEDNEGVCLVTGNREPIEMVHNPIKMRGAQPTGAALVSYNGTAFCSYGKNQGQNAPVGKHAAFAYVSALNYLLNDDGHAVYVGDTVFLFWASNGVEAYQNLFNLSLFSLDSSYTEQDLYSMLTKLCKGEAVDFDNSHLNPEMDFYVLGLSPNAARISVKFFYHNTFESIIRNVMAHHERMKICSSFKDHKNISVYRMLFETVNKKSRDAKPVPNLTGELVRSIVMGYPYPTTLLNGIELRMRAERDINYVKAAILKAYYLKMQNKDIKYPEEVLTVSLCKDSRNVPYNLGRLFAILEKVQKEAIPGISVTIRDKYWNSASSTPAHVMPVLVDLAGKHLKKLSEGRRIYYERMIGDIMSGLGDSYPVRLSLPEKGACQLGFYHQMQYLYTKKEDLRDEDRCN